MRRKILGFLLLALVVCAGIVFVELKSGNSTKVAAAQGSASDSVFCAVLGGSQPEAPEAAIEPATGGRRDAAAASERLPPDPAGELQPLVGNDPAEPDREPVHSVRSGDSLTKIAQDYLGSKEQRVVERIVARNALKDRNAIHAGTKLVVPVERFDIHLATGAESIADIAEKTFGSSRLVAAIIRFNPTIGSDPRFRPAKGARIFIPR